ncbi:ABC transporter ATP-binding protein [Haladaptatus sp. CMSO5]|uniref:ABC transporter ATP-binding protein n=1 Tax=Haladaptatus sp. CMSO5 TaxID=3120514 RepID=UPI002FCE339D
MSSETASEFETTVATGQTLVEVNELKTYYESSGLFSGNPVKAVDGVNFEIKKGETLGLVGESGCGKTTLGRTLVRLEKATGGEVKYKGTDITKLSGSDLKNWRRNAQIVFQDPESSLNDRMTVGEIIREPLDVHEIGTPRDRRDKVRNLLETVGLREEHYFRYPHQFSGGQRQRIGIARALALEPEFVVLDEPVSALDVSVQAKILNLLDDLQQEFGLTYLFIAHDLSVVRHICDRTAVMYLGHIMEIGDTEELFTDPANPYTLSLLSAIPDPNPTVERERITLRGTPPSPRDPPKGCPFSTRCPTKIRPPKYEDLDDEVWSGIELLREIVRERTRADKSIGERAREVLGMETRFSNIEEINREVFGDLEVPAEIRTHLTEAEELVASGNEKDAAAYLRAEFGSICDGVVPEDAQRANGDADTIKPEQLSVSESGRLSLCHRHKAEYQEPSEYLDEHIFAR